MPSGKWQSDTRVRAGRWNVGAKHQRTGIFLCDGLKRLRHVELDPSRVRARSLPGHGVTGTPAGIWAYQFRTGSPGALSSGGCGLANPIVPGCALLLTCFSPSIVVMKAASIATLSTIAKMTMTAARACRSAASFFMTSPPWRKENDARRLGLPTQALGAGT